jgi:hypothetical protein
MSEALASITGDAPPVSEPEPPTLKPASRPPPPTGLDMDWDDLESGFDAILSDEAQGESRRDSTAPQEVTELFKQIAVTHLAPVRDFVVELELGQGSREWILVCLPAIASIKKSAEGMGVRDMIGALEAVREALEAAQNEPGTGIGESARIAITDSYNALAMDLPHVYEAGQERSRREPIIVQSLLRQVHGVRDVALDKLYSAGLVNLQAYYSARPEEISETTGLPLQLCQAIVARFASYRDDRGSIAPDDKRKSELSELSTLTTELDRVNREYERSQRGWSRDSAHARREARKQRNDLVLKINLVLARLGEVDLVKELERLPFERKVESIEKYVEESKAGAPQV